MEAHVRMGWNLELGVMVWFWRGRRVVTASAVAVIASAILGLGGEDGSKSGVGVRAYKEVIGAKN